MIEASLLRVTKRHPCRICGKQKYCGVSADGELAICMSVADGSMKESANGGYVHILESTPYTPSTKPKVTTTIHPFPQATQLAPIERRHEVFVALLDYLPRLYLTPIT